MVRNLMYPLWQEQAEDIASPLGFNIKLEALASY